MKTAIYEARKTRGWTSAQLNHELREAARRLSLKVSTSASLRVQISGWENGRHRPDSVHQLLLQEAFNLPADALDFHDTELIEPSPLRPLVRRNTQHVDISDALLRYFVQQLAGHVQADNLAGPSFVLATADLQLRQLEELAQHGAPEVGVLAARYAEFTGWLLQDSGDDLGALRHTDRAVELAEASGDASLAAYNLMRKSSVLTSLREWQRARLVRRRPSPLLSEWHQACSRYACASTPSPSPTSVTSERRSRRFNGRSISRRLRLAPRPISRPTARRPTCRWKQRCVSLRSAIQLRPLPRVSKHWHTGRRSLCATSRYA